MQVQPSAWHLTSCCGRGKGSSSCGARCCCSSGWLQVACQVLAHPIHDLRIAGGQHVACRGGQGRGLLAVSTVPAAGWCRGVRVIFRPQSLPPPPPRAPKSQKLLVASPAPRPPFPSPQSHRTASQARALTLRSLPFQGKLLWGEVSISQLPRHARHVRHPRLAPALALAKQPPQAPAAAGRRRGRWPCRCRGRVVSAAEAAAAAAGLCAAAALTLLQLSHEAACLAHVEGLALQWQAGAGPAEQSCDGWRCSCSDKLYLYPSPPPGPLAQLASDPPPQPPRCTCRYLAYSLRSRAVGTARLVSYTRSAYSGGFLRRCSLATSALGLGIRG
jgi:hypothetical protein